MSYILALITLLGVGALSGIRLYATVFLLSICVHFDWITLPSQLSGLQVLDNYWIMGISLVFLIIEALADKIPWLDSLWDSVHTFIRPIGAMILAFTALGEVNLMLQIIAILMVGSIALGSHTTKMGARGMINLSPEPVSNIVTSLAEDSIVAAGVIFIFLHPIFAVALVLISLTMMIWLLPKFWRLLSSNLSKN